MTTDSTAPHDPVDILLVGLGSIGTVYALLLEKSGRARVSAVARSNYELYSTTGVRIDSDALGVIEGWKPYRVFKSQEDALADGTRYELGLLATKALPDITRSSDLLAPALASGQVAAWALIQNGLGVEADLAAALKATQTPLVSSVAWIGSTTSDRGALVTWRNKDTLVAGVYPPTASPSAAEAAALELWTGLLKDGGSNASATDNIDAVRFGKNVWNAVWSSFQGLVGTPTPGLSQFSPEDLAPLRAFAREVIAVGYGSGLLVPGAPAYPFGGVIGSVDETLATVFDGVINRPVGPRGGYKMSLLVDVENRRPIEVEVITGAVLRLAREHGIDTPLLAYTYSLLRGVQNGILAERKQREEAGEAKA
ncbi:hypothetical protein Q8F55_007260 [Vanrija albida]|uniref:2-dehydropantoate 2-reductase n=1 Tax=Vanrija albida TaxID=181172 RepID=A0ABR3PZL9_9TREE